jgi:predicted amidophosphoribosyltransferase
VDHNQNVFSLQSKQCPQCSEPNKLDSKFCAKCMMVLTYDAYRETLESQKETESEVKELREKYERDIKEIRQEMKEEMKEQMAQLLTKLKPEIIKQGLS